MSSAPNRLIIFGVAMFICLCLITVSIAGLLAPAENVAAVPLGFLQQIVSGGVRRITGAFNDLADLQNLRERNAELERALVNFQREIVDLREIKSDYDRLSTLLQYVQANPDQQTVAASVIGYDTTGLLRTININRGTRDGIAIGMPVVSPLGLVGRVYQVTATAAQVQLITDVTSFINARLQTTRATGVINGTASGNLILKYVDLTSDVTERDSVVTSGIGGNFPRGILIGQVTNVRIDDSQLFKEAQVRSLVDFNRLEIVLVVTNFTPIDFSAFATPTPIPGAAPNQ
ncbi:MAG: rod shape-determining protein MreC [Anaerolineae bacterium]|nr:rod shape-determining protein MreC [Anaerolineae bacterium]